MRIILNCIDILKPLEENNPQSPLDWTLEHFMQLRHMQIGEQGKITRIHAGERTYRHRLIAMGLIPGTPFTLSRIAPLGDPIEISVRGFALSLRKEEANILEVTSLDEVVT